VFSLSGRSSPSAAAARRRETPTRRCRNGVADPPRRTAAFRVARTCVPRWVREASSRIAVYRRARHMSAPWSSAPRRARVVAQHAGACFRA
jgi:hypothetical protein